MQQLDTAPVLAIDGPSGSGKGTIARLVAASLGWHFLDSGALYRAVGLKLHRKGLEGDSALVMADVARHAQIGFVERGIADPWIYLDGEEVSALLRDEAAGAAASRVAAIPEVRTALLDKQQGFRRAPGLVADGRDMGTVVFPDARLKVFLEASVNERAKRRFKQLSEKGIQANLDDLQNDLADRDRRDRGRAVAPLRRADDAIELDSTHLSIAEVVHAVLELARERGLADHP